jgi:hypothetical protein
MTRKQLPRQPPRRRFLQHERPGKRALVQCPACDRDQARVVLGYAPDGGRAATGEPPHKKSGLLFERYKKDVRRGVWGVP